MISQEEIASLVKMADKLDSEGRVLEAAALDSTIQKLVTAAEKEKDDEEKESGGLTNKQRAAIKGFMTAAERVERAFARGAPRGSCRKVDDLAEQVLEACKSCNLD